LGFFEKSFGEESIFDLFFGVGTLTRNRERQREID